MAKATLLLAAVLAVVVCTAAPATALSWPLCEGGGAVWVTERPRTEQTFPGANLWFFCDEGMNILVRRSTLLLLFRVSLAEAINFALLPTVVTSCMLQGNSVDECVGNGTVCGAQVATTICNLLGYGERSQPACTSVTLRSAGTSWDVR